MVRSMKQIMLVLIMSITWVQAHAQGLPPKDVKLYPAITVSADAYPGETYYLGYGIDADGFVKGIYYQDDYQTDPKMKLRYYSNEVAEKSFVLVSMKGHDVVKFTLERKSNTDGAIFLAYLRNGITKKWREVEFKTEYEPKTRTHRVVDARDHDVVTHVHVKTNFFLGKEVGISDLVSK